MIQEEHAPMHTFRYALKDFGLPLERFSVSEFNDGIATMLARAKYERVEESGAMCVYASEERQEKYLLILHVAPYDFIFYIPDDASLMDWKRAYAGMPGALWLKTFLPGPKTAPEYITMHLNKKALRGSF